MSSISRERLVSVDAKLSLSTPLGGRRSRGDRPTDSAAVSSKPPYRFRSRGTRDPTRRVTVAAEPPMTVSLFCRWFLSRFSSAVRDWLQAVTGSGLRGGSETNFTPCLLNSS